MFLLCFGLEVIPCQTLEGMCFIESGKMTFNPFIVPFATEYVGNGWNIQKKKIWNFVKKAENLTRKKALIQTLLRWLWLSLHQVGKSECRSKSILTSQNLAEVFVRPLAGYLWSNKFAKETIGHLWILGIFSIALGLLDFFAPFWVETKIHFLIYGGIQ